MRVLVTGGAGFIGSNLIRKLLVGGHKVLNIDKLTYAGNRATIQDLEENTAYRLVVLDICDQSSVEQCFIDFRPHAVIHLAAESHVDRSIRSPTNFINSNIFGTYTLLQAALAYWRNCDSTTHQSFRFLHVSTDEVYGSLGPIGSFVRKRDTTQGHHIHRARPRLIIWCERGGTRTNYRLSWRVLATTMARFNILKSSFRLLFFDR